jgi:hypothetical protein
MQWRIAFLAMGAASIEKNKGIERKKKVGRTKMTFH